MSAARLFSAWKSKCVSLKTVKRWLSREFRWAPPVSRPFVAGTTSGDATAGQRKKWAAKWKSKEVEFWRKVVFLDGHTLKKPGTLDMARRQAARTVRGNYRRKKSGAALEAASGPGHCRHSKGLKEYAGKATTVLIAVSLDGFVDIFERKTWNKEAAKAYFTSLGAKIRRSKGKKGGKTHVLRDNDPTWSGDAIEEKVSAAGLSSVPIPAYSPDVSLLDFYFNAELDKRIREYYTRRAGRAKKTTRAYIKHDAYMKNVRRIARAIVKTDAFRKAVESHPRRIAKIAKDPGRTVG